LGNLNEVILGGLISLLSRPDCILGVLEVLKRVLDLIRLLLVDEFLDVDDEVVDIVNVEL
jgi:hypothetical protein